MSDKVSPISTTEGDEKFPKVFHQSTKGVFPITENIKFYGTADTEDGQQLNMGPVTYPMSDGKMIRMLRKAKDELKLFYRSPSSTFYYCIDSDHRLELETSSVEVRTETMTVIIKLDDLFRNDVLFDMLFTK